jgi:ribose-phosphate pyrophosphokinase
MKFFALEATKSLGARIASELSIPVAAHEERDFEDTEFKIRALEDVEGERVLVCQSLAPDGRSSAADKLLRLLIFIGSLKDGGASAVAALVPYLAFARKDRRTKPGDPVTTRYVASFFEAAGTDAIVTADVHNLAAFDNAFRCRKVHVEAAALFVEHFARRLAGRRVVVLSPDAGGMKRASSFAEAYSAHVDARIELAIMEKQRSEGVVSGRAFGGDVDGAEVIVVDDLISTGTTMLRAARAAAARGAAAVHIAATHAVFADGAAEVLSSPEIESVVVTDTTGDPHASCPSLGAKLEVLGIAGLFGGKEGVRALFPREKGL